MSKFLKFKLALSLAETIEYLSLKTGEAVNLETIELLFTAGHLTPIVGYGQHIVGFNKSDFEALLDGTDCTPFAHSMIGCPCDIGFGIGDVLTTYAKTTDGEDIFFAKPLPNPDSGEPGLRLTYNERSLAALDPTDRENWSFPTSQVHAISNLANAEEMPPLVTTIDPPPVHIDRTVGFLPQVTEIRGLLKPITRSAIRKNTAQEEATKVEPPSYKLTIFALLDLLNTPSRQARNQSGIITEILERHPGTRGLSKRNLEEVFATANKFARDL